MFENLISVSGNSNEFMTFHFARLGIPSFSAKRRFSTNLTWNSKTHLKRGWCHHMKSLKKNSQFFSFLCSYLKVQGGRRFSTSKAINKRPFFVRIEYKMAKILFLSIPFQCAPATFQASSSKMEFGR